MFLQEDLAFGKLEYLDLRSSKPERVSWNFEQTLAWWSDHFPNLRQVRLIHKGWPGFDRRLTGQLPPLRILEVKSRWEGVDVCVALKATKIVITGLAVSLGPDVAAVWAKVTTRFLTFSGPSRITKLKIEAISEMLYIEQDHASFPDLESLSVRARGSKVSLDLEGGEMPALKSFTLRADIVDPDSIFGFLPGVRYNVKVKRPEGAPAALLEVMEN